jgi:hypothetical protein
MEKGMLLKSVTKTKNDVFGTCIWEIVEVGLPAPEVERAGQKDGIKVKLLSGSGPSAKPGFTLIDSEWNIGRDIAKGTITIVSADKKDAMIAKYGPSKSVRGVSDMPRHGGTGVVEV